MLSAAKRDAVAAFRSATGAGAGGGGFSLRDFKIPTSKSFIVSRSLSFGNQIPRIVAGPRSPLFPFS